MISTGSLRRLGQLLFLVKLDRQPELPRDKSKVLGRGLLIYMRKQTCGRGVLRVENLARILLLESSLELRDFRSKQFRGKGFRP